MKFYTHKMTSVSVIDAKFHKNPLCHLRYFQLFQTAVTNRSYLYDLLPCWRYLWTVTSAGQCPRGPAHRASETVALLSAETPDFISPLDWPPNSPDLNPVDYAIWGILQEQVYHSTAVRSVTSTIWKNDWLKSGIVLIRTLLTEQWISGVIDCINVCTRKGNTSNIWFEHFDCSD